MSARACRADMGLGAEGVDGAGRAGSFRSFVDSRCVCISLLAYLHPLG